GGLHRHKTGQIQLREGKIVQGVGDVHGSTPGLLRLPEPSGSLVRGTRAPSAESTTAGAADGADKYSWIAVAARRPAPIAKMTVAPPVTMSPPANTPVRLVRPVASSTTIVPLSDVVSPGVRARVGLGAFPTAITATSTGTAT